MDKEKIARSFSRSASTYDSVAYFQRDTGDKLLQYLLDHCSTDRNGFCLDLGCGPGSFYKKLQETFGGMDYIGLDLAEGMLSFFNGQFQSETTDNLTLLCADAEQLPIAENAIDLIYSNMALQWCEDLNGLLQQCHSCLKSGSYFAFTSLGPDTLFELKQAWQCVDNLIHVNHFIDNRKWQNAIVSNGFEVVHYDKQEVRLQYTTVMELLKELKLLGAHNVNSGQRQSLTAPKRLQALLNAYERFSVDDLYPATYEVDYWILRKN
jgi:malonyl-CoA O-methyltransferase